MRTVVLLLLLANLTLFGYTLLDSRGSGEAVRLKEQVRPDKITILTPQQVAALGPGKLAALADVCLEWGPLSDAERTRALGEVEGLQLGRLLTQRRVEPRGPTFLVVRDPQQAVVARLKDLQSQYPGSDLKVGSCPTS
jgi:hypothetical protein